MPWGVHGSRCALRALTVRAAGVFMPSTSTPSDATKELVASAQGQWYRGAVASLEDGSRDESQHATPTARMGGTGTLPARSGASREPTGRPDVGTGGCATVLLGVVRPRRRGCVRVPWGGGGVAARRAAAELSAPSRPSIGPRWGEGASAHSTLAPSGNAAFADASIAHAVGGSPNRPQPASPADSDSVTDVAAAGAGTAAGIGVGAPAHGSVALRLGADAFSRWCGGARLPPWRARASPAVCAAADAALRRGTV